MKINIIVNKFIYHQINFLLYIFYFVIKKIEKNK